MRYLGIDPGKENFALVLLNTKGICIYASMFRHTIKSTAGANYNQRSIFRKRMYHLLERLAPDAMLVEEFMVRGFGTNLIELIALMLGGMQVMADHLGFKEYMVMPSSWKGAFKRQGFDLQTMYDDARQNEIPPHIVDALLLATYLKSGFTFEKFSLPRFNSNLKRAKSFLKSTDLIKRKRVFKNDVSHNKKGASRKRKLLQK